MTFNNFSLHPKILKALSEKGYLSPTEIQAKAIPKILQRFDIRASAQTGTGKTGTFLLPCIDRVVKEVKKGKGPRVLVLVPTRELAIQVADQARLYSKHLAFIKTVPIFGGIPYIKQLKKLQAPYDILVATPGRLLDFIKQKKISLSRVEVLVLDEADRMLDMGFVEPVRDIVKQTPSQRQTLLFSATLESKEIRKLSEELLQKPMDIVAKKTEENSIAIEQKGYFVSGLQEKTRLLEHLLQKESWESTIIFTSTKRSAEELALFLQEKSHPATFLHGDMNQSQRNRTVEKFRQNKIKILVATDVASRGIDIKDISHVVNFDLPRVVEDYTHRIGRTARAGSKGIALSLISKKDLFLVKKIEQTLDQKISIEKLEGFGKQEHRTFARKNRFRDRKKPFPKKRGKKGFRKKNHFS